MENYGVKPDIEVVNYTQDEAKGVDPQRLPQGADGHRTIATAVRRAFDRASLHESSRRAPLRP
jgi:hypothetical protein